MVKKKSQKTEKNSWKHPRSRHRKFFMHRVYSAQRGIETMGLRPWSRKGPDHGVGVDPSLLKSGPIHANKARTYNFSCELIRANGLARLEISHVSESQLD